MVVDEHVIARDERAVLFLDLPQQPAGCRKGAQFTQGLDAAITFHVRLTSQDEHLDRRLVRWRCDGRSSRGLTDKHYRHRAEGELFHVHCFC